MFSEVGTNAGLAGRLHSLEIFRIEEAIYPQVEPLCLCVLCVPTKEICRTVIGT